MSNNPTKKVDVETTKLAGEYLFGKPKGGEGDSEYLDMRTIIHSDSMSELLLYYGILGNTFGSNVSIDIKDTIERLLISRKGIGRDQAVITLKQNFPKRIEVEKGWDEEY